MSNLKQHPGANGASPNTNTNDTPNTLSAEVWRQGAPDECAYFVALVWGISDDTPDTLDRFRVTDFNHPTSAHIYEAATALRARGVPLYAENLEAECTRRADECDVSDRPKEAAQWENARDALAVLAVAPKGSADQLAVQLADKLAPRQRWEFTSLSTLRTRPRPLWLIQDILVEATAAVISGDSQSFKTFSALDMALCIATGTPWQGHSVRRGTVVYIAAEGGWTLRDRLEAWETAHGIKVRDEDFLLLEIPVAYGDPETVARFSAFIKAHKPVFVVIDTLSACFEGLKENASEDMATFVRHMKATATDTGATNAVIHHNNKGGDMRGAVALKNDADTHITFARSAHEDDLITVVSCSKQRGGKFAEFALQGEQITLSTPDEFGREVTSLVFEKCDIPEGEMPRKNANARRADATRAQLMELFDSLAAKWDGVKTGTWQAAATEAEIVSKSTFHRHLEALSEAGEVEKIGDVWHRLKSVVPQVPQVPNETYKTGSEGVSYLCPTSPTHPLGVGLVGQDGTNAVKPRKRKGKNSADGEPYKATP